MAVSLIILSIILLISISLSVVSVEERKASISSNRSGQAYQNAESGREKVLNDILKGAYATTNQLPGCNEMGFIVGNNYTVELKDNTGTKVACNAGASIALVKKIKSTGMAGQDSRAIESVVPDVCGNPIQDVEGNIYNTVKIGVQCWMRENLRTTKYPDGTDITRGPTGATWDRVDHAYYAYPPNTTNNAEETLANIIANNLGFVYQFSVATHGTGAQGVCPDSWHIPIDSEWMTLEESLGMCSGMSAGCSGTSDWRGTDQGTQMKTVSASSLSGLLAGGRIDNGGFYGRTLGAGFWASQLDAYNGFFRILDTSHTSVYRNEDHTGRGFSVRCVRN